jgi:predicted transcriptional regulator
MAEVTITDINGQVKTKNMSQVELVLLLQEKASGQHPNIVDITIKYESQKLH